ncbi:glycosyltransferase [Telmatospirillum siberiense]|uniref:Glycosyltransferase n=1 Tax=Telmatospirillum siberiense TaxID=382514 RepID=A0A2N3PUM4_9PROT|nr:glycosyltransferase [Telmatospirillum siberiense]PKU24103.1 glycosyltransferase [Telmatospirillum siberiense]
MRVTILIPGTEGDVRPLVALGRGMQAAGHSVRIATTGDFVGLIEGAGLEFASLPGNSRQVTAEHQSAFEQGRSLLSMARMARDITKAMVDTWPAAGKEACHDADLILAGGGAVPFGVSLAEALDRPFVQVHLQPNGLFASLPSTLLPLPPRPLPGIANRLIHRGVAALSWWAMRPAVNDVIRAQLGLSPYPWSGPPYKRPSARWPTLFGFSEHMVPRPRRWCDHARVSGYWFLDRDRMWQPPEDLAAFLEAGERPVYIGLGSMSSPRTRLALETTLRVIERSGRRAVVAVGWSGAADLPIPAGAQWFVTNGAPHDWLFPRVTAAIHHGGAGTTAAAVRAGIPSIILPLFGDQHFWAWRLQSLGAAVWCPRVDGAIPEESLSRAIARIGEPALRRRARQLAGLIGAERGVDTALMALHGWGMIPRPAN